MRLNDVKEWERKWTIMRPRFRNRRKLTILPSLPARGEIGAMADEPLSFRAAVAAMLLSAAAVAIMLALAMQ